MTKIKVMRPRKSQCTISRRKTGENCQKNTITGYSVYSEQTAIPSILSILLSGAELMEYYSVHSGIRIGPKRIRFTANSHSGTVPKERALNYPPINEVGKSNQMVNKWRPSQSALITWLYSYNQGHVLLGPTGLGWFSWSTFSTHSESGWNGWKQWVSPAITIVGFYPLCNVDKQNGWSLIPTIPRNTAVFSTLPTENGWNVFYWYTPTTSIKTSLGWFSACSH